MPNPLINIISTRIIKAELKEFALINNIKIHDYDFLSYEFLETDEMTQCILNNTVPVIFTSQQAILSVVNLMDKKKINLKCNDCFAIGGSTADSAEKNGFKVIAKAPTSELLADEICKLKVAEVVHFCGDIKLSFLSSKLKKCGTKINELVVYTKELSSVKIDAKYNGIMFFSPSQIDSFLITNPFIGKDAVFCIGNTTAEYAALKGFRDVSVAENSSERKMIELVVNYFSKQK